ncbi:MAG TPA: hypothetical protein VGI89_07730 [Rhizomicrobium sp.]
MTSTEHPTPGPKIPEHLSTAKPAARSREEKIDRQMEDSFPASDPPSFSGGNHVIGAPKERESEPAKGDDHEVVNAEKRVKKGNAGKPEKY